MKKSVRPALWILLFLGLKPKSLITLGYPKGTVNKYHAKLPKVRKDVLKALGVEQD